VIRDPVYAVVITAASVVSTSAAVRPPIAAGPVMWAIGGIEVPVVAALIGVLATLLVRIIVVTSNTRPRRNLRAYNVAVTLLTMLGTATWITDNELGPGAAFWTGLGCGALGVSLIEIAKSQMFAALKAGLRTALAAFLNGGKPG
jgi:hypothetical protein